MFEGGGRGSLSGVPQGSRRDWSLAALAVLAAPYRLLGARPVLFGKDAVPLGDGWWHAMAARALADGVPHGWIDATDGGFPVGLYYPIGGWLLVAFLVRLGCSAAAAVQIVGVGTT